MSDVQVFDHVMGDARREDIWQFLSQPGWRHGAYSGDPQTMPRYDFKHFAGFVQSGLEPLEPPQIVEQLNAAAPLVGEMWGELTRRFLKGQLLSRCYANSMPVGVGGGVHHDSPHREHLTAIYYPQPDWSPNEGGETLFFNRAITEVVKAVVPKPDRLVVFAGSTPHVARPIYRASDGPRITLMFKTLGRAARPR